MKNNILLVLMAGALFLCSCGTMTKTAQNTQTGFVNSIYYAPDKGEELAYNQSKEELAQIQNETNSFLDGRNQTIYVGDTNVVTIDYNPEYTYSIVDDQESYEARLRKFDSPVYTVNIEWNPSYNYDWYNWNRWYTHSHWGWYNPWYRYSSWHNPWYYGYGYGLGWYDPWYTTSWYSPYYGWYDPWYYGYGWAPAPFPNHSQPHNNIYYGHRNSSPSYNATAGRGGSSYTRNMANVNQIRGNGTKSNSTISNGTQPANRGGSAYRRGGSSHNGAIYSNAASNAGNRQENAVQASNSQSASGRPSQGSMYRRSATQNTRSSVTASSQQNGQYQSGQNQNSSRNQNSNASYNNSNNSYYRNTNYDRGNSGNYGSAPARSSGSSSGSYNSQRTSGSSYRR